MDIFLFSDILPGMAQALQQQLSIIDENETINVHINSSGGSVVEGTAIVNLLTNAPNRVNTHIDGLAASMATVIALAGEHVTMSDGGLFMIHNAHFTQGGTAAKMRVNADLAESLSNSIADVYKAKTGLDKRSIKAMMDKETTLTANEALKHGFVDSVVQPMRAVAKWDINSKNMNLKESILNLGNILTNTVASEEVIEEIVETVEKVEETVEKKEETAADVLEDHFYAKQSAEAKEFFKKQEEFNEAVLKFIETQKSNEELKEDLTLVVREELNDLLKTIKSKARVPVGNGGQITQEQPIRIPVMKDHEMSSTLQGAIDKKFKNN